MFEDYLEDANYFAVEAAQCTDEREAKRYYRASVFCAVAAIEAFINHIGDTFAQGEIFQPYEIAFLTDRKFCVIGGRFHIRKGMEYHRLEDKLRFLICRFIPKFDFNHNPVWSRFLQFKRFRDAIIHAREHEDEVEISEYESTLTTGLSSIIEIIDSLCQGIFKRPLRRRLLDLSL